MPEYRYKSLGFADGFGYGSWREKIEKGKRKGVIQTRVTDTLYVGSSVEGFIDELREIAAKYEDASVDQEAEDRYGSISAHFYVSGWRDATEGELANQKELLESYKENIRGQEERMLNQLRVSHPELFK